MLIHNFRENLNLQLTSNTYLKLQINTQVEGESMDMSIKIMAMKNIQTLLRRNINRKRKRLIQQKLKKRGNLKISKKQRKQDLTRDKELPLSTLRNANQRNALWNAQRLALWFKEEESVQKQIKHRKLLSFQKYCALGADSALKSVPILQSPLSTSPLSQRQKHLTDMERTPLSSIDSLCPELERSWDQLEQMVLVNHPLSKY